MGIWRVNKTGGDQVCDHQVLLSLMEQESGGRRIYRSADEMAAGRKLKGLLNQTWFKSKRGGSKVTLAKDLPWRLQSVEEECKREHLRINKKKRPDIRDGEGSRVKSVETVVFIPSTPGFKLRIHLQDADDRLVGARSIDCQILRHHYQNGTLCMKAFFSFF